jgi:hypothetical protein
MGRENPSLDPTYCLQGLQAMHRRQPRAEFRFLVRGRD